LRCRLRRLGVRVAESASLLPNRSERHAIWIQALSNLEFRAQLASQGKQ